VASNYHGFAGIGDAASTAEPPGLHQMQGSAMLDIGEYEFERLVGEALDSIPSRLRDLIDNVAIFIDDEPPADDPDLLGLYEGVPLTERGDGYFGTALLPDTVTIFRLPILRLCASREQVVDEVRITVVHEVAHHFGIEDDRLHELGWS